MEPLIMTHRKHPSVVAEGHILAGPTGLWFETQPDRRTLELALDEDPAGFVGMPVRAKGVMVGHNRFAILAIEHIRASGAGID
jgi:hypothetical protein